MKKIKENLAKLFRASIFGNSPLYHAWRFERKKSRCDKVIKTFLGEDVSPERKNEIKRNMRRAMVKFHWDPDEYFLFGYENLTDVQRMGFFSEYDKNSFCDKVNNPESAAIFKDKWATYKKFRSFYHRDAVFVSNVADVDSLEIISFLEKHHSFIMKPNNGALGNGIEIIHGENLDDAKNKLKDVLEKQLHPRSYILEELIKQVDEMAKWHPQSVNTIRIRTFILKDRIHICHPLLRTGCGDSFVDNTGSGGVFVVLDQLTGKPICACDEYGNEYSSHPDSGLKFAETVIPRWNEAVDIAKQLAMVLPDVKYVGWDLALTENGWVMIEGNDKAQLGFQYATHIGFRREIEDLMKQM